jgi:Tol biopolymer transport system component
MQLVTLPALLAVIALFVTGCTRSDVGPTDPLPSVSDLLPLSPATSPAFEPRSPAHDRLLVLRDDGTLLTMAPDGARVQTLSTGADQGHVARQPVWSPDGRAVAWAETHDSPTGPQTQVVASRPDGNGRTETGIGAAAFYLQWDPTSSRVAYLGNVGGTIGMGVVDFTPDGSVDLRVGSGVPFYLSWSPDGDRLIVHINGDTLGFLGLDGVLSPLPDLPATFQAPIWLPDGRLVLATRSEEGQSIVLKANSDTRKLASFDGQAAFVASPDGRQLAYTIVESKGKPDAGVVDLRSGKLRRFKIGSVAAFFWRPDSRALLLLTAVGDPDIGTSFRWLVWNKRIRLRGTPFLASPAFVQEYLPFFSQYAQAMSPWSPDGSAFAYAGLHKGQAGIWVQAAKGGDPVLVGDGEIVAWSPT